MCFCSSHNQTHFIFFIFLSRVTSLEHNYGNMLNYNIKTPPTTTYLNSIVGYMKHTHTYSSTLTQPLFFRIITVGVFTAPPITKLLFTICDLISEKGPCPAK